MNSSENSQQSLDSSVHQQSTTCPATAERSVINYQLVYTYTRAQAIADGFQIDVTKTAQEAGIRFPVFITRGVYEQCVAVPAGVTGQDEAGRLWDVVWMLRFAILKHSTLNHQPSTSRRLTVALYVRNSDKHPARLITLRATAGALDIDDSSPAITVMLPAED